MFPVITLTLKDSRLKDAIEIPLEITDLLKFYCLLILPFGRPLEIILSLVNQNPRKSGEQLADSPEIPYPQPHLSLCLDNSWNSPMEDVLQPRCYKAGSRGNILQKNLKLFHSTVLFKACVCYFFIKFLFFIK